MGRIAELLSRFLRGETLRVAGSNEDRFRRLTALSADWFWESDVEHRMTWLTGGAAVAQLLGSASSYGKRLWEVPVIEIDPGDLAVHLGRLERLEPFRELEIVSHGPGGARRIHVVSGEPRFDEDDRFLGYRGVGKDVTAKRRAEEALAQAKERLELAISGSNMALWDLDVVQRRTFLGQGCAGLLGRMPCIEASVSTDSLELAHPQDRTAMRDAFSSAIRGNVPVFSAEGRFRTHTGEWKWLQVTGRVTERDANGRALRMSGLAADIDARKRAEQMSREAEARYRALVDLSPDGVVVSWNSYIEYANAAAERILGVHASGGLVGRMHEEFVHADDLPEYRERMRYLLAGPGTNGFVELRLRRADGSVVVAESASVSFLERGRLLLQTVVRDVTEARAARERLAEREQRFSDVVEASDEYVWETDAAWRYTYLSGRVESVLGFTQAEMLGRTPREFMPLGDARSVNAWFQQRVQRDAPFRELSHRSITKSGRVIWQLVNGMPVYDRAGALKGYRGTGADVTARRLAEERIQFLATRDPQTGLPNRLLLAERADQAIVAAARSRGQLALLTLDLDRFKLVNDSLGHAAGDFLLRAVSERLANTLRRQDTLARLGGDEFALLWDGMKSEDEAEAVARRLQHALGQPFSVDGRSLGVTASIGIAVYPGDGATFGELFKNADLAMSCAKHGGRNGVRRYAKEMGRSGNERLALENDLRRAVSQGEFVLHYQPVLEGRPGIGRTRIVGAEVLVRWQHPQRGLLMPDAFIPVAEETGLVRAIGEWTMDRALAQISAWKLGPGSPWFALNVSPYELADGNGYLAQLEEALRRNGVRAGDIELEVTERALMANVDENIDTLQRIGALCVRLAIDDFGTGYSSLAYLRRMPIDKLKIDQSFVRELASNRGDAVIVETIASMAKSLGLHVSAEGVEDKAQLERLLALGCGEWQGHLCSRPLEARAFEKFLDGGLASASVA